jgi:hypothetical protein
MPGRLSGHTLLALYCTVVYLMQMQLYLTRLILYFYYSHSSGPAGLCSNLFARKRSDDPRCIYIGNLDALG